MIVCKVQKTYNETSVPRCKDKQDISQRKKRNAERERLSVL